MNVTITVKTWIIYANLFHVDAGSSVRIGLANAIQEVAFVPCNMAYSRSHNHTVAIACVR